MGDVAQTGEHLLCKQGVSGSIPLISTKKKSGLCPYAGIGNTAEYSFDEQRSYSSLTIE